MLRPRTNTFPSARLYKHSAATQVHVNKLRADLCEPPLDRQLTSRPRKGPAVAHNLDVYKKMHKLHNSAKWKQANVTPVRGGVSSDLTFRNTHKEGRYDTSGMYRDWLYGNDRRYVNFVGFVLFVLIFSVFSYTIKFLGSDKWDMPAPLLKTPDLAAKPGDPGAKFQKLV